MFFLYIMCKHSEFQSASTKSSKKSKSAEQLSSYDDLFQSAEYSTTKSSLVCSTCGKVYSTPGNLKRHIRRDHDPDPNKLICAQCSQLFRTQIGLDSHNLAKHAPIYCDLCGKCYYRKGLLANHRKTHAKEFQQKEKFICKYEDCQKTFQNKNVYDDHINVHTGREPYKCRGCSSKFKSRIRRNLHQGRCMETRCKACKTVFCDRVTLMKHVKACHSMVACGCGARFSDKQGLSHHQIYKNHVGFNAAVITVKVTQKEPSTPKDNE